eukprot:Lithocolla_globosa_v1_NODE_3083_length_1770_cov_4.162099.p2 type:complete len:107 gc:universal NODE_3083_length_1770_cov_4.162099:697-1017(+)
MSRNLKISLRTPISLLFLWPKSNLSRVTPLVCSKNMVPNILRCQGQCSMGGLLKTVVPPSLSIAANLSPSRMMTILTFGLESTLKTKKKAVSRPNLSTHFWNPKNY